MEETNTNRNCLNQNSQDSKDFQNKKRDSLTYKVIGCAILAIELGKAGLIFEREKEQTVYYENIEVGTRRADFVVEGSITVELKALICLEDVHLAQAKNYLEAYNFPIGLLINFGSKSLEYKLLFNKKLHSENFLNSENSGSDNERERPQCGYGRKEPCIERL